MDFYINVEGNLKNNFSLYKQMASVSDYCL